MMQVRVLSARYAAQIIGVSAVLASCGDTGDLYEVDSDQIEAEALTPPGATSGVAAAGAPVQPCLASAGDERAAETMARACGSQVEVESERSAYSQLYVEPSGLRTVVTSVVPQRARRSDGTWGPIDTTLKQVGDVLAPVATAAGVRFSTGGTGPLVTLTSEGHTFTLSWPAPLPRPRVAGDSATYSEVLPGVDLVVKATEAGFTPILVVKTARAAANPAVRQARYRIGGDASLTSTPEGGLLVAVGGTRLASTEAAMWSIAEQQGALDPASSGTGQEPAEIARVGSSITEGHLVLTPDASVLTDADTIFPMAIAPPFSTIQWAYASILDSGTSTTDNTVAGGDPSPAATVLKVGNDPESSHLIRSFMRFSIASVAGKQILGAKIDGKLDHSTKCGVPRPTYFYRSAGIGATPRQAWPGPGLQRLLGNNNVHANEKNCSEQNMPFEVSSNDLINDLQASATTNASDYFVAISAGENTSGFNETHAERWMRYFLNDFKLHITFNSKPNTPDNLTVDDKPCAAGPGRPFVKTTTPTLRARVSDPDNEPLNVWFAWARWNGSAFIDAGNGPDWSVPNGGTALFDVTGNVDGGIYTFRVQSDDGAAHQPFLASDVTHMPGNCEWQVDISPPAIPTVISDVYLEEPAGCSGACGSVGQTGRFTFTSSADTLSFRWGFSDPPTNVANPPTLGGSAHIDFTPTSSGLRTLFVRAIDRAGNESNKVYQFQVAAESTALARWLLNDPAGSTELGDDTGNGNTVAVDGGVLGIPGRIVPGADGVSRSAMQFDGSGTGVSTAGPVLADTSKSFSVAAWVKLTDNTTTRRVLEQVGSNGSAFRLEYDRTANAWRLTAPTTDGSANPGATSTSIPRLHTWTHLTGTYDSAARVLKLYVNGALESTATGITTWDANAAMRIGHGWAGAISEVQVWNRVISVTEVFDLSDPILVGHVGEWRMSDVGPGPTFDSSGMAHDLTFFGGALIPPGNSGQSGTGLRLDGVNDSATTDGQVLQTDQSFTVSVWARPTTTAAYQTFVSQQSSGSHAGFALYFAPESGGAWKFRMHASATSTTGVTYALAPATDVTTTYHHLVGVFDAQRAELRLYVDGVLKATTPMNAQWQPWSAPGPLLIGRHHFATIGTEFTSGDLDEVRVYQGVVVNVTRIP